MFTTTPMSFTRAAGFLIYRQDSAGKLQFFVERRSKKILSGGTYGTPGGFSEGNETPLQTAFREIHEELGITREDIKVRYVHRSMKKNPLYSTFIAEWSGKRELSRDTLTLDKAEVDDVDWFYPDQIPSPRLARFAVALPVLQRIIGTIIRYIETHANLFDMSILDSPMFLAFFDKWHVEPSSSPDPTRDAYLKMLRDFTDWREAQKPLVAPQKPWVTPQNPLVASQKPPVNPGASTKTNNSPTTGIVVGTSLPSSGLSPVKNPPPNPQPVVTTTTQVTGTTAPTPQYVRDELLRFKHRLEDIVSRGNAELGNLNADVTRLRKRCRDIDWDIDCNIDWDAEMGGPPSKKPKTT